MENLSDHLFMLLFIVSAREYFDIHFRLIRPVNFPSEDGKDAVCKGRNGGKVVYFPPESSYFLSNYYD